MPLTGPILMTFVVLLLGCNGPDVREPDPEPAISQSEVPDTGGADQPTVVPTVTEATFQFASTAAADLTGDGRTDTLRVGASGNDPMDIEVYPQEQRHEDAQDIWHQMIERDRVTFQVQDGVYTERLVWSQSTARFFGVWGCC